MADTSLAYATSSAFLEAYRRCMHTLSAEEERHFMAFPALVCAAFSAEVGLKTILHLEGRKAHGHDLLDLFMLLSDHNKVAVMDGTGVSVEDFARHLKHSRKAFVEWRYIYEAAGEKVISLAFMGSFAAAVDRRLSEMRNAV